MEYDLEAINYQIIYNIIGFRVVWKAQKTQLFRDLYQTTDTMMIQPPACDAICNISSSDHSMSTWLLKLYPCEPYKHVSSREMFSRGLHGHAHYGMCR